MPGLYIDSWYLVLVVPAMLFAMVAQGMVSSRFRKYSGVRNYHGVTGAQAAERVMRAHGVYGVSVEAVPGNLTDHFDPRTNTIRLSMGVHDSASVAAVGIAAHEAGHAVQHAQGYAPIKLRQSIIPVTQFGSTLSMPLIFIGLLLSSEALGGMLFLAGIVLFGLVTLFQLVTLPVEFDASRRAMETLRGAHVLDDEELGGVKKVLWAAAMTYVAALAVSLAQLLRFILIFMGGGSRRRR